MNAEKLLFTGDNVNPHLWIHRPGAVAPEEWMDTARLIPSYMEQGYTAHTGHGSGHLTKADSLYPEKGGETEIQFDRNRIART